MTNRLTRISVFAVLLGLLLVAGSASGQGITTKTTAGTYTVVCDGYLTFPNPFPPSGPPNFQFSPTKLLGVAHGDKDGLFNGSTTLSIGGFFVGTQTVSGTETVNPDGTGHVTYAQTLTFETPGGPVTIPGPPLDINFVVSEHGDRIDGISTDPGTVFSCVLRRSSRDNDEASVVNHDPSPRRIPVNHAAPSNSPKSATARVVPVAAKAVKRPSTSTSN